MLLQDYTGPQFLCQCLIDAIQQYLNEKYHGNGWKTLTSIKIIGEV